jgi:predicted enzyme related to lactoylglutathione lyase
MPKPDSTVAGGPIWIDLMTTDTDAARAFYGELFGWTAETGSEEFGGYFNFLRAGEPVAGGMGYQPGMPAEAVADRWSVYLRTDDAEKTVAAVVDRGGQVIAPPMPVGDLGAFAVVLDPGGAAIGLWQPGTHAGFAKVGEPGAPSWFELFTREFAAVLDFYRDAFGWTVQVVSDTDEFRYATLVNAAGEQQAGVMDASSFLPAGAPSSWSVYFNVEDADAATAKIAELGGKALREPEDTPYGRITEAADTTGATFKIMGPNKG